SGTKRPLCDANNEREISIVKIESQLKATRIAAGIACALLLCVGPVAAQMDPGSGARPPRPVESKVPANQTTPNAPANEKRPQAVSEAGTTKSPTETSETKPDSTRPKTATTTDPIAALRDQIDAAPTAEEKMDLQLKLVEQLVRAGKKQEARNQLGPMLAEDRFDPQAFYNIGNAFARLGDLEGAVVSYR